MLRVHQRAVCGLISPVRSNLRSRVIASSRQLCYLRPVAQNTTVPLHRFAAASLAWTFGKHRSRSFSDSQSDRIVKPGDTVKVLYKGFLENGEVFINGEDDPIEFDVGTGEVVIGLERGVVGMQVGEKRVLTIPPEEGFGAHDPELVYDVPTSSLDEEFMQRVRVGSRIRLDEEPDEEGEERYGVVVDVRPDGVTIDTNEELVGKTLVVHVTVMEVTPKEKSVGAS